MDLYKDKWMSEIGKVNSSYDVEESVSKKLEENLGWDEPFFVGNLDIVLDSYKTWKRELPNVEIFYAVKANDDPLVLKLLVALGTSFDCSSMGEVQTILKMNVSPDRIMFSNPYKLPSHLKYAAANGVRWMVCDSLDELRKMHSICPSVKLVIRLNARREMTAYPTMSQRFGCNFDDARQLLVEAKILNLNVEGLSFYVGHCTDSPSPYADAIEVAKEVYLEASVLGFKVRLLDIGGGFQGSKDKNDLFSRVSATIRESLTKHFPADIGVRVIGEPGQFMAISAFDVYTKVVGVRFRQVENGEKCQNVVLSAGNFSCLNNLVFKYNRTQMVALKSFKNSDERCLVKSVFWGPTCDPMDILLSSEFQPLLRGMWLKCTNLGAYTRSMMTNYNGFSTVPTKYFMGNICRKIFINHFQEFEL